MRSRRAVAEGDAQGRAIGALTEVTERLGHSLQQSMMPWPVSGRVSGLDCQIPCPIFRRGT
jgi:hypothetical protein